MFLFYNADEPISIYKEKRQWLSFINLDNAFAMFSRGDPDSTTIIIQTYIFCECSSSSYSGCQ